RPAPAFVTALVRFDRLFSSRTYQKGRAVTMAVIGFRWGAPQPKRSTTVKWFALSRSTPPSPAVQARLQALAGRTWEVLCGFRVPFLPLAPGIYQFRYDSGDSRQTTPKDLVDPVLTIGPSMKRGRLEFSYRGVRYVAHYAISADITIFPARLTPELRTRGMCLRGFRKFCTKPYRSAPRKP
ncbi:MAG: hypothetical protein KC609_00995, partial [Myxococcales bacterium]|nr:hypothetical protein [Myxococcales bacterium]